MGIEQDWRKGQEVYSFPPVSVINHHKCGEVRSPKLIHWAKAKTLAGLLPSEV